MGDRKGPPKPPEAPTLDDLDTSGQITLPLGGEDYVMRPSWEAIQSIERQLRPLFDLAGAANLGKLTIEEMAVIAAAMMRAHGKAAPEDANARTYNNADVGRLAELIYEAGAPRVCARLSIVLIGALTGGYTAAGERKPATETTGTAGKTPAAG
ncbi:MAG TPA: GTA-gp10 family protein [Allosphingosinicella sp.]|jgi:hypothetical protein